MKVKPNHPLAELLAQLLHGIEVVNAPERRRMANRACREATKWHKEQVDRFEWWVYEMEKNLFCCCPECGRWAHGGLGHKEDCDLFLLVSRIRQKMKETREKNNEDSIS